MDLFKLLRGEQEQLIQPARNKKKISKLDIDEEYLSSIRKAEAHLKPGIGQVNPGVMETDSLGSKTVSKGFAW